MAIEEIKELFAKSDASGSKSTIVKPLTWFISILSGTLIVLIKVNANHWVVTFVVVLIAIIILLFLFTYIYCLFKDRDSLRSEKFTIQKMAIQKGLYGDNLSGLLSTSDITKSNSDIISNQSED